MRYWSLYFIDEGSNVVTGGTFHDRASAVNSALAAGWIQLSVTIPAAPEGTTGILIAARTGPAAGGLAATYWIDEVTIRVSGTPTMAPHVDDPKPTRLIDCEEYSS